VEVEEVRADLRSADPAQLVRRPKIGAAMSIDELTTTHDLTEDREVPIRVACGVAALATLVPFALCEIDGRSGSAITSGLEEHATSQQLGAIVATFVAALLVPAALRIARRASGLSGAVIGAAGVAVAVMYVAYYASFGAAAVVADQMLDEPGPGLGEATALLVNLTEITRYAPGLALVGAAVAARRFLPRGVWIPAAVLAVMTVFPLTSWVAALIIPVWLGASAAALGQNSRRLGSSIPRSAS
jgi:hypothetical protein